jgi:ElaB/YqjD/DUF883 family membrane-anchored ribosome-binding protein
MGSAANEARRAVDEVQAMLEAVTHEDLAERANAVNVRLAEAREALKRAASEARGTLRPVLHEFNDEVEVIEQRVRENPLGALLAAAGVGLLLGLALSKHR